RRRTRWRPIGASRLSCCPSPGVGNATHRPPPSPPLPPQGGASKRLSDPNSLLRDPSRRVVRVTIGHKPGVFRGTGGSNPVPFCKLSVPPVLRQPSDAHRRPRGSVRDRAFACSDGDLPLLKVFK